MSKIKISSYNLKTLNEHTAIVREQKDLQVLRSQLQILQKPETKTVDVDSF